MRTLVTGAAGFIGSALVDRLLAEGHHVVGVDDLSSGTTANLDDVMIRRDPNAGRFSLVQRDIRTPELIGIVAGANPEVVFHLAAQTDPAVSFSDPQLDARINVLGTINLCEASRRAGVHRVVYAASGRPVPWPGRFAVGCSTTRLVSDMENSWVAPRSPYEAAKLAGEVYLSAYAEMYGLAPICLAFADVYDPGEEDGGQADLTRDRICVADAVEALVRAGRAPVSVTGTYYIGAGASQQIATDVGGDLGWTAAVGLHPEGEEVRRAS
ncbi:NAD-dependent epimerase/dehydratase family protein [Rhodococcus artemisiae]|uniref:NAD-dependent epimerase/dehydratase family protein n=1 Tax=Rhodococcus artemisiae TaxID=714159 RepID=A0ABU7LDS5_9NOCA|nr:NAD-dependent epimerase/dehydratase family protein [Rhodococcus artemisiae]MEE2059665.1 NAD-dependent epimerase/dehydratase family protein [Rhodococcus artemisiae]